MRHDDSPLEVKVDKNFSDAGLIYCYALMLHNVAIFNSIFHFYIFHPYFAKTQIPPVAVLHSHALSM